MPINTKEAREKLGNLHTKMEEILERSQKENRPFNAEETAEWKRLNDDFNQTREFVLKAKEHEERGVELAGTGGSTGGGSGGGMGFSPPNREEKRKKRTAEDLPTPEDYALALQGWCRSRMGKGLKESHKRSIAKCRVNMSRRDLHLPLPTDYNQVRSEYLRQRNVEQRSMSAINLATGGALVASGFVNNLEVAQLYYNSLRPIADVWRTEGGGMVPWPTVNDTGNEGEILGENKEAAKQDVAVGAVQFTAHKFSSKMIVVPHELLEDSAFNLVSFLGSVGGERIGRRENRAFTLGGGVNSPKGVVPAATTFDAAGTAITFDDVQKLFHSVDPSYRGNAHFMFHDAIVLILRTLKDQQNRPLWIVDPLGSQPDSIMGKPYAINQHMDSTTTTGKKTILFGDFSKYKIRDVASVRLRHLVERYAENDQEGFVMFKRADGNLLDAGTHPIKVLKH